MSKVEIKNDWAKAIYILYLNKMSGISMAKVLSNHEPSFYKWQTRFSEVERANPKLRISRTRVHYKSKMDGKSKNYIKYTPLSPDPYILKLINELNEGFKSKTNSPNK